MVGWRFVVLALLLLACGSEADPPSDSVDTRESSQASNRGAAESVERDHQDLTEQSNSAEPLVTGIASHFERLTLEEADAPDEIDRGPAGELTLTGCRWRGPGLYSFDFDWQPDEPVESPVVVVVEQGILRGDQGFGWAGYATLTGAGKFSVPHDTYAVLKIAGSSDPGSEASANRSTLQIEQDVSCFGKSFDPADYVPVEVDPLPVGRAAPGSVEELVATIDPTGTAEPLLPLVAFAGQVADIGLDRLYVARGFELDSIRASLRRDCLSVRSQYLFDGEPVLSLIQSLRCPEEEQPSFDAVAVFPDDIWTVTATGPEAAIEQFTVDLEQLPFNGVTPLEIGAGAFDASAAVDAEVRESDFTEILRVPWDGGLVAIGYYGSEFSIESYADPIVAVPEVFRSGGTGTACRDYAIVERGDSDRGFGFIVLENDSLALSRNTDGDQAPLAVQPAEGGRQVIFYDLANNPGLRGWRPTIVDDGGDIVPCVQ